MLQLRELHSFCNIKQYQKTNINVQPPSQNTTPKIPDILHTDWAGRFVIILNGDTTFLSCLKYKYTWENNTWI